MSGKYNGAQAVVSRLLNREVPYIHACDASPIVSELFDTLQATYSFFSGSTKRYAVLHDELQSVENSLILRNLSLTRWTARAESLRAMWISYEAVIEVLRKISNDGSVDAKGKAAATGLLAKVLRVDFVVSLMFMRIILWKTKVLTESLQKEDLNIVDALEALNGTVKSLQDIRKDDEGIANQIQASADVLSGKDVDAAKEAEKRKHIFPLTSQVYRLALTAPVTVAGNERTSSKLKTVKTALRNSMSDHCLQNLILLTSEKDITDSVDIDMLVDKWFMKTNRRINL